MPSKKKQQAVATLNGRTGSKPGKRKRKPKRAATSPAPEASSPPSLEPWPQWLEHLQDRKPPVHSDSAKAALRPLSWGLSGNAELAHARTNLEGVVKQLRSGARANVAKGAEAWRSRLQEGTHDLAFAIEAIAWARRLPELAAALGEDPWNDLLDGLQQASRHSAGVDVQLQPLLHQWLHVELPLTLATLLPELDTFRGARKSAWKSMTRGLQELLDGNGMPRAQHWLMLQPLAACWVRCAWLDQRWLDCDPETLGRTKLARLGERALDMLNRDARLLFEWAVREVIRGSRRDGGRLFAEPHAKQLRDTQSLVGAGLAITCDAEDVAAAGTLLKAKSRLKPSRETPEESEYSEWAALAVMRSGWRPKDPLMGVGFGEGVAVDLFAAGARMLHGPWDAHVRVDGNDVSETMVFSEVCWYSDEDCDYLELESPLNDGWSLQRQVLFARKDAFVYLADAVVADGGDPDPGRPPRIEYQASIPVGEAGVVWKSAAQTREGELEGARGSCLVLPLQQPEWRSEHCDATLSVENGCLTWSHAALGTSLYVPIWINLDQRRGGQPHTWRRLTVARELEICPPSEACGYRVQHGAQQWLFYRSLAGVAVRSVLGQNVLVDFSAARFRNDGSVSQMIEIEAE